MFCRIGLRKFFIMLYISLTLSRLLFSFLFPLFIMLALIVDSLLPGHVGWVVLVIPFVEEHKKCIIIIMAS